MITPLQIQQISSKNALRQQIQIPFETFKVLMIGLLIYSIDSYKLIHILNNSIPDQSRHELKER